MRCIPSHSQPLHHGHAYIYIYIYIYIERERGGGRVSGTNLKVFEVHEPFHMFSKYASLVANTLQDILGNSLLSGKYFQFKSF